MKPCMMWLAVSFLYFFLQLVVSLKEEQATCDDVEIVSREEWRARPPVQIKAMKLPLNHVIIEHTATTPCKTKPQCIRDIQSIQDDHLDNKGWPDVAYNFLIGDDGRVYEGSGWKNQGSHSRNFNSNSLGVAFVGDYRNVAPNQNMLNASLNLIKCGVREGYLSPTREIHVTQRRGLHGISRL